VLGPAEISGTAAVDAVIGRSPAMQEVYKAIGRVAPTEATVLIRGDSGTGKELIARAIYQHSRRSGKPLLVVNCAAIPETLLESELFGYERGAFTGAAGRHVGKFEQADGGTIFLDEIGDVSLSIQAKILRVIQEKTFERLGGTNTIRVDVRVLAATNRDLEKAIASGGFREDLYHRLNVVTIQLPPLRDRRDDIPALADYFLDRYARELKLDKPLLGPDARQRLQAHSWPGNVRELEHCMQRVLIFARGYTVRADDLLLDDGGRSVASSPDTGDQQLLEDLVCRYLETYRGSRAAEEFLERAERLMLIEALRRTGNNQTHAARLLGLTRPTFHAKLQKHRLHDPAGRADT
jgi:transcriptional regulator with GAF, ATPase, and Fis domain